MGATTKKRSNCSPEGRSGPEEENIVSIVSLVGAFLSSDSGSKRARDEEDDDVRRWRYLRDWLTNWSSGLPVWHRSRSTEQIASSSQCTNSTVVGITAIASCDGRDTPAIVRSMIRISPPPARIRHWLWDTWKFWNETISSFSR